MGKGVKTTKTKNHQIELKVTNLAKKDQFWWFLVQSMPINRYTINRYD